MPFGTFPFVAPFSSLLSLPCDRGPSEGELSRSRLPLPLPFCRLRCASYRSSIARICFAPPPLSLAPFPRFQRSSDCFLSLWVLVCFFALPFPICSAPCPPWFGLCCTPWASKRASCGLLLGPAAAAWPLIPGAETVWVGLRATGCRKWIWKC